MKIELSRQQRSALLEYLEKSEDCEKLSEKEWILDIYDEPTPISLDLVFESASVFADGAEYLKYDEEMDGWYMCAPIEDAETILDILRQAGAL